MMIVVLVLAAISFAVGMFVFLRKSHSLTIDNTKYKQMIDSMPVNVLIADLSGKIINANKTSIDTLRKLEHLLPIRSEQIVGQSYDIFHKNPAHQKKILANPANLPHKAVIDVGDEKLDLLVTPIYDQAHQYNGAMLTWSIVTEKVKLEEETKKLTEEGAKFKQMINAMPINVLMADLNGNIVSANPSSIKTLKTLEHLLPVKADQLIGQSYDIFHKNPAYQRKILASTSNLPHKAVIGVGNEMLDLLISPILNQTGTYSGAMLTWSVVTEQIRIKEQEARIKKELDETVTTLKSSSQNLETTSEELSSSVSRISHSSNEVQNYANSVSVATEEMISSISEISKNTDKAAKMTQDAVTQMESTENIIRNLQERSDEIASILKVVTEIANQTNLLALNATIEAARAGEAGKGFAVVANEVKELANRTAEATGDIGNKIAAIQSESANALSSIGVASASVKSINEVAVTIAGSVEEQTAVTAEIGKSMRSSTERVSEMSSDISEVTNLVKSNVDRTVEINDVTGKLVSLMS
jgi:methyl-accepting chemotaxis protein